MRLLTGALTGGEGDALCSREVVRVGVRGRGVETLSSVSRDSVTTGGRLTHSRSCCAFKTAPLEDHFRVSFGYAFQSLRGLGCTS